MRWVLSVRLFLCALFLGGAFLYVSAARFLFETSAEYLELIDSSIELESDYLICHLQANDPLDAGQQEALREMLRTRGYDVARLSQIVGMSAADELLPSYFRIEERRGLYNAERDLIYYTRIFSLSEAQQSRLKAGLLSRARRRWVNPGGRWSRFFYTVVPFTWNSRFGGDDSPTRRLLRQLLSPDQMKIYTKHFAPHRRVPMQKKPAVNTSRAIYDPSSEDPDLTFLSFKLHLSDDQEANAREVLENIDLEVSKQLDSWYDSHPDDHSVRAFMAPVALRLRLTQKLILDEFYHFLTPAQYQELQRIESDHPYQEWVEFMLDHSCSIIPALNKHHN